ncbi:uncharacterized protein LOC111283847 [Durio zibethinus]|uniref:Uncharacterized protein LOC111283847 n=1 Tax=Durio zibethinus TaxID=66656 RepID=A0A6P5XK54_DURZI|nr:uncharacterized protein LOC111283847 [Durio zibethinus]
MDIEGLGLFHVKSHLQKYRLGKFSVKEWQDTAKNVSQLVGGSRGITSLNSVPPRANGYNRGRKAKQTQKPQKGIHGNLYLQMEAQKHVQRCLEAQRRYLNTALERACEKLTDQYLCNAATENATLYGQPPANLGTFTTMSGPSDLPMLYEQAPANLGAFTTMPGTSDLGTMATMPQFYFNQQNAFPTYDTLTTQANLGAFPTYDTLTTQANLGLQEVPFGYQPQTSLYPASEGFSTSYGGCSSSSYQETFPALTGNGKKRVRPADEDPTEAFLNWDDNEPMNLDAGLNFDNLQGFPGTF